MLKYSTKEGIFETDDWDEIPWRNLHSSNNDPTFEDLSTCHKRWHFEGLLHRETGPAIIYPSGYNSFWLNGKNYENVNDWPEDNPNQDETFQAFMRLKYS